MRMPARKLPSMEAVMKLTKLGGGASGDGWGVVVCVRVGLLQRGC